MSFDVILSGFHDGEPCGIEEDRVRAAFGQALVNDDADSTSWRLDFDGEDCDVFITRPPSGGSGISSLMISRPIAEETLWESLFQIMGLGHVMTFYLGCPFPLVADESAIPHIPDYMLEAIGHPVVVSSGAEISRQWSLVCPGVSAERHGF